MPLTSVSCSPIRFIWEVPVEDSNVEHFFQELLSCLAYSTRDKGRHFFVESVSGLNDFLRLAMDHGRPCSGWV